MTCNMPSRAEQAAEMEERREEVKSTLSEAAGKAARMQENARKLNQLLIQKQTLGFEEREQVRELVQEQTELEKSMEQVRREKIGSATCRERVGREVWFRGVAVSSKKTKTKINRT